ncbi:MAG: tripartite tricarboxylate transporter TctB family protein [Burkholderiales bacterium]
MTPANELMNDKRFLSGLMFLGIGAVAIYMAQDYPMGSALRMGPGYFPIVLGAIMALFGIYELILGVMKPDPVKGNWSPRALVVLPVSAVIFGVLMERAGFVLALIVLIFVAAASSREFKFIEVVISAVVLTAASVGLFIYGLGLPYPLFSGH